ncbi:MAG: RNA recognition motif domain-containing protein [Kiritimatiellia bacterium]
MEDGMATRLYVGNLPFDVCEADVREMFGGIGEVSDCNLIVDKFTNKSRGFAFVEMASKEDAEKAVAEYNGKDFKGRPLTVNEARPREERGGRGGDFGGFSRGGRR